MTAQAASKASSTAAIFSPSHCRGEKVPVIVPAIGGLCLPLDRLKPTPIQAYHAVYVSVPRIQAAAPGRWKPVDGDGPLAQAVACGQRPGAVLPVPIMPPANHDAQFSPFFRLPQPLLAF